MYKINVEGQKRLKHVKNEFIKSITIEPIIYSFIIYLVYLSIGTKVLIVFFLILAATVVYFIVFGIYAPIRLMKRQNRTISEIDFENNEVLIKTDKVHWLKPQQIKVKINSLTSKPGKFKWYGIKEKEGLSIFFCDIELFLVNEYFDEYEDIKELLTEK